MPFFKTSGTNLKLIWHIPRDIKIHCAPGKIDLTKIKVHSIRPFVYAIDVGSYLC